MSSSPVKLIIDTDPGIDDAMAIFYAALAKDIELVGLTSIFGNVTVEKATRNCLRLVEMARQPHVEVAQGAIKPLGQPAVPPSAHVHGEEGFGDIPALDPKGKALEQDAADFLIKMSKQHERELVVCTIGPITNIAEALRRDPGFAKRVKQIVVMGGAFHADGNITTHAEANVYHDPHALAEVEASGAPLLMVGLDVTDRVQFSAQDYAELAEAAPVLGSFLQKAGDFYLDFYVKETGVALAGLHDPSAVIACTHPELFTLANGPFEVILDGEEKGRTKPKEATGGPVHYVVDGNLDAIKAQFIKVFQDHGF